jgi:hypothetical protein
MNVKLYDIEDDIIDRGEATNLSEALDYYKIDDVYQTNPEYFDKLDDFNIKLESDYHNSYFINGKYQTRTIKLNNKLYHKLNDNSRKIK